MQTDVIAKRVTGTGSAYAARTRLKGISFLNGAGGAGRLTITDGSGGATLFDVDMATSTYDTIPIPGEGILFETGLYVATFTNLTAVTLYYG